MGKGSTTPELAPNAFIGQTQPPTEEQLTAALGSTRAIWDRLLARLAEECKLTESEWNSSGSKYGWALRLKLKKRNIVYLGPCHGAFRISFILGDKAVEEARRSTLPRKVIGLVESGTRYPEGTAVRLEIGDVKDIAAVVKLAAIKIAN